MKTLDPGHLYDLAVLDGGQAQALRFVKRCGVLYPGNTSAYGGTTSQQVLIALLDRCAYVQGQRWCFENVLVGTCLRLAFWLLELRASRRHNMMPHLNPLTAWRVTPCECCLHIRCGK